MKWLRLVFDFVLMLIVGLWVLWVFWGVPPAQAEAGAWAQKLMYIHVPSAIIGYVGLAMVAFFSLGVLLGDTRRWDPAMRGSLEVSYVFASFVIITGPFWARPAWGTWWRWEPQLTTFFIMWLMFGGWFLLRNVLPEGTLRKTYSAIYSLLVFFNVPVVMASAYFWQPQVQLHPREDRLTMEPIMNQTFYVSIAVMGLIFARFLWLSFDLEHLKERSRELIYEKH
ncbi:MAG: cytochrome c biogenesis protein [bacterium]